MTYNYEAEVKYHDDDPKKSQTDHHNYYRVLEMFNGTGTGHKKTLTSTMNISSETELTKKELEDLLGEDISVLSFEEV